MLSISQRIFHNQIIYHLRPGTFAHKSRRVLNPIYTKKVIPLVLLLDKVGSPRNSLKWKKKKNSTE